MARLDLRALRADLYAPGLDSMEAALKRGAGIMLTHAGDGDRELVSMHRGPLLTIEGSVYPDRDTVRLVLLRRVVQDMIGEDAVAAVADPGARGDRARLAIASAYGGQAELVLALIVHDAPPQGSLRLSLRDILAGADDGTVVVVFDAHRLSTEARWDLRELTRPLLLVTRPDQYENLVHADAPFYGHSQVFELHPPSTAEWMRELTKAGVKIHPSDLEWLLSHSRGRIATTAAALEFFDPKRSPRDAWREAVKRSTQRAVDTLTLAASAHSLAPALLVAIADGRRPYTVIPGAQPRAVSLALRKLHAADLTEQPKSRTWRIADPLVEGALRAMSRSDVRAEWAVGA